MIIGAAGADAAAARPYCPDRPDLDTPPCTIDDGRLSLEVSLIDWTRDNAADVRTDTLLGGDLALRYGVADNSEVRFAWTPFVHQRVRDKMTGAVTATSGTGDIRLGFKRNLLSPDGSGLSLALLPSVVLPTGSAGIGAGDWGAGVQAPVSKSLTDAVSLILTPEIDAAVDQSGSGRHLAWGSAGGIAIAASNKLNLAVETALFRDDDPGGATTSATGGIAAGIMLGEELQLDLSGAFGLNAQTPGLRLAIGVARRF